ncbi:MAG: AAA family ATPase, partial [Candidatus Omnitrophica bacterium]|nr:AAA family ATPase [Candidatus Omnitrophota bacterium]
MYFKKLEIFGFKSFADKTVLNFEPGITAIVGPNGCGKSNIFDAIRWVLGEQSIKQLRGSAREDVIFNGTDKKQSLGFAEVSLTFSNESRLLPIDYNEVTITRRLYRSGESDYLINKTSVRLKDIHELLMGTGIGAEAYSLVQQGKVDLVVSAKPEDRRIILDEASGITKYKTKKKEALSKLKSTEDNLLRVNDITVEVKRQIGSIERQAKKAQKFKVEFEKLKHMEVCLARYQINNLTQKRQSVADELKKLKEKEQALESELETLSSALTDEINYLDEIEQKINEVLNQEIKFEGQIDVDTRQIGFNRERIENLTQSEKRLLQQKEQLIEKCRLQQIKIEEIKAETEKIKKKIEDNRTLLDEKRAKLDAMEGVIKEAKDAIKDHETKILELTSQQVSVRNQVTETMKDIQGAIARKRRLELENQKVSDEKVEIDQKLRNAEYQIRTLQTNVAELGFQKEDKAKDIQKWRDDLEALEGNIDSLEKRKLFLKSQKEFVETLNMQYQGMSDGMSEGKFYTSAPPLDHHSGIIGKVRQVRKVSSQQQNFVPGLINHPKSQELYEITCETKFIDLDPKHAAARIEDISGKVKTLEQRKNGVAGNLEEKEKTFEYIRMQIHSKEKALSVIEAQYRDIIEERGKLTGELDLVDTELYEVTELLAQLKKKEEELNYKLDTIGQDLSWSQNDIKERQGFIATKGQEREALSITVAQMETEIESERGRLSSQLENQTMFVETLDGWLGEIKNIEDEVSGFDEKREEFEKEIKALEEKIESVREQKEALKSVKEEYEKQKEEKGRQINAKRARIKNMEDEGDEIKQRAHDLQMSQQEIGFSERGIKDRLMQSYKIDLNAYIAIQTENSTEPVDVSSSAVSAEESVAVAIEDPGLMLPAPSSAFESGEVNEDEITEELEVLRKRCDSFGNVNLSAMDEYEELKERFEFLTKQQADLLEAKSDLMSTINKINRSTRQMFMDTFTKVSEEFRIYFRMLFGGGDANLLLLDPDNVLESGIEIVARPPGKKLQSISLMSGGEKTLTAIALIFGVFKVNPSPFCVLDEIDAALDESNVGRFSYLLKDFAKIAQFIVITHNKKTI